MIRGALLAALLTALAGAGTAQAAPCGPGPEHPPLQPYFEDLTFGRELGDVPAARVGHRIGIDGSFPDGSGLHGVIPGSLRIFAPGVATSRDGGTRLAIVPQSPGTIPVTFTWTESENAGAANPVPACEGSAVIALAVVDAAPIAVKLARGTVIDRPDYGFRLTLRVPDDADASAVTVRGRVVSGSTPPRSRLRTLATLPVDNEATQLERFVGKGSFGRLDLDYDAADLGGVVDLSWTTLDLRKRFGTRVSASGKRKIVSKGALSVELLQRGRVRARLRTAIECGLGLPGSLRRYSCRTRGLRFTT